MKKTNLLFIFIMLVILLFSLYFISFKNYELDQKKMELNLANIKINNLNDEINDLDLNMLKLNDSYKDLNQEHEELLDEYNNLDDDYNKLDKNYYALQNETKLLIEDINVYKKEIKESIEWFNFNSYLDNSTEQRRVKTKLESNCIEIDDDDCSIKLGCFFLVNQEKLDIEYKYDIETSNATDKLQSLSEFVVNKGGDCEDYSFFYKAEYNYLLEECEDRDIVLEGWRRANSDDDEIRKYWLNFQKSWYLDEVVRVEILEDKYPNVICGNLFDPIRGDFSGHCMIAFTKEKIDDINDLYLLDNASIIEPQDGSYVGKMNDNIHLMDEEKYYDNSIFAWIRVVITDNDYYLFSFDSLEWNSYTNFYNDLVEKEYKVKSYK